MAQLQGNSGAKVRLSGTVTVDVASIAANLIALTNVTLADVVPGDTIILVPPSGGLSVLIGALPGYCTTAGTAIIPFVNPSVAALDAASAVFDFQIIKKVGL